MGYTPPFLDCDALRSLGLSPVLRRWLGGVALIVRIVWRERHSTFRLRMLDVIKVRLRIPRTSCVLTLRQIEDEFDGVIGRDIAEECVVQLAHGIERLH